MLKNSKGITLVALVVTIVILIILAAVSISVALNTGLTDKAKQGVEDYKTEDNKWVSTEANIIAYVDEATKSE